MTQAEQLRRVWNLLGEPRGSLRYFAKSDGRVAGGWCRSLNSLTRAVNNLPRWDFYVTLNPTTGRGTKAKSRDVIALERILIDIDPLSLESAPSLAVGAILLSLACTFDPYINDCCSIIDSGRGKQIWLEFTPLGVRDATSARTIECATRSFLQALQQNKGAAGGCIIDTTCSDLSRVARCPGTINWKTGRMAFFESIAGERRLSMNGLLESFPPEPPIELQPQPGKRLYQLLPHMGSRPATYLTEGIGSPGRHAASYAAACSLRDLGVPYGDALAHVKRGARLCRPPLPEDHAGRSVIEAYRKELFK